MKNSNIAWQITNIVAVLATIAINGLANALPLNGQMTGEISDRFKVFFVPAGYVFAIWGLIYLGLISFAVYQALPAQRSNPRLQSMGYLFALSCAANIGWLFAWHYEQFVLSMLLMLALLVLLIVCYQRLEIGRGQVGAGERWLVRTPFSIYLGWITVATIANATALLDYLKWSGWGIAPALWATIMLAAAVVVTGAVWLTRRDSAYALVIIWALIGIALKHASTPLVAYSAWAATAAVVLMLVSGFVLPRAGKPGLASQA
jgi:hypothetical protein